MNDDEARKESDSSAISRRDLFRTAGAAGAAALIPNSVAAAVTTEPIGPGAAASMGPSIGTASAPTGPLMNLTARETEILSAMVDRLIPSDELGPGALEAGTLRFIDRALSEAESDSAGDYRSGLAALDRYSQYSRGAAFVELSATDQDSVLIDLQTGGATGADVGFVGSSSSFFNMVKSHTWQGTFGDPHYGGNVDFVGWDLIAYPGVRLQVSEEDQRRLEANELTPIRRSAYDYATFRTDQ